MLHFRAALHALTLHALQPPFLNLADEGLLTVSKI